MKALKAIPAEHEPTSALALDPGALRIVDEQPHSTTRLRAQDATALKNEFFRGESVVPLVVLLRQQLEVVDILYGRRGTAHRTGHRKADLRVSDEVSLQQFRSQIVPEAV